MTAFVQKPKAVEAPSPKATVTCEADCSALVMKNGKFKATKKNNGHLVMYPNF